MRCDRQVAGTIELYFYGELPQSERAAVKAHLNGCAECRAALDDLSVIRAALASRPDEATPPGGDWSGFMRRLNAAIAAYRHALQLDPKLENSKQELDKLAPPPPAAGSAASAGTQQ